MQIPGAYRRVHAKHHTKMVQRATEAIRLTAFEQATDVACSIAALNLVRAHPLSRTVYNIVIVWLIIELHSGVTPLVASPLS
jgi:sterol desaturase/sphingolipid hydroxylase (fatty acid hydroxylase superfamily)